MRPSTLSPSAVRRASTAAALLLGALFLASVARFYHPGFGFSAFVIIPEGHEYEIPALRGVPHYEYKAGAIYDGSLYVQLAMEPLLRDPAIDLAMDAPAYRARRILFCWTAYALGLGKPYWILQAYSLQNVLFWILLAWLMTRWIPPTTPMLAAVWAASMFSHGLMMSVRMALLDGPSMFVLAAAVAFAERGQRWLTAITAGIAGLGRETNLLGGVVLPRPHGWRGWLKTLAACVVIALPLMVWQDYIWSIYRGTSASAGVDHLTVPLVAWIERWQIALRAISVRGLLSQMNTVLILVALTTQAVFIVKSRVFAEPWWRLAGVFMVLMLLSHADVWKGYPPAITRVVLPMKFGFNVLLVKLAPKSFWTWFVAGNLDVIPGVQQLPLAEAP
jgi:hypothetical protein